MDTTAYKADFARTLAEAYRLLARMQATARDARTTEDSRRAIEESQALLRRL